MSSSFNSECAFCKASLFSGATDEMKKPYFIHNILDQIWQKDNNHEAVSCGTCYSKFIMPYSNAFFRKHNYIGNSELIDEDNQRTLTEAGKIVLKNIKHPFFCNNNPFDECQKCLHEESIRNYNEEMFDQDEAVFSEED